MRILIANRGEIACRIIRTARSLGWHTIAVYSDADAQALHVRLADSAMHIGPAPAAESYLVQDAVLDAAERSNAGFIHPGYGFLAENAQFAAACAERGLVFVGPPAAAILAMGDKSAAKHRMEAAGVPCLPGYHGDDQSDAVLCSAASDMGFPVLLKPSAGGGGKGMHVVQNAEELPGILQAARREARSAFGDDRMLIEKYLERARHVEIQVFCDNHGNSVYLFERDCSVQRRHQKIIEEAPAPGVDAGLRERMGRAAVQAAAAIDYRGAGTIEFLLAPDGEFFFMEMNTRLQVEHPVTEMITGQDLVAWQLSVALGAPLPLDQAALRIDGHAVEARIYAEDPARDFLPSIGAFSNVHFPHQAPGVRIDSGISAGQPGAVSPHYDPMIAKIIAHGTDREQALSRLSQALAQVYLPGITTNAGFARSVLEHPEFRAGVLSTRFLEDHQVSAACTPEDLQLGVQVAAVRMAAALQKDQDHMALQNGDPDSPWARANGWRLNALPELHLEFDVNGERRAVVLHPATSADALDPAFRFQDSSGQATVHGDLVRLQSGNELLSIRAVAESDGITVFLASGALHLPRWSSSHVGTEQEPDGACHAPMSGTIVQVQVAAGDEVSRGADLVVLEAMKMEHTLRAPVDGTVSALLCTVGDLVQEGQTLLEIEETG